jgi:hypothetical protein
MDSNQRKLKLADSQSAVFAVGGQLSQPTNTAQIDLPKILSNGPIDRHVLRAPGRTLRK